MYKLLIVVLAVLAVASAQYLASPYYNSAYGGAYGAASVYGRAGYAVPAVATTYGSTAYGNLGYRTGGLYY